MIPLSQHPALTLSSEVEHIAAPLLKKFNLNYFQFMQVHQDGSYTFLCSHAKWVDFVVHYSLKKDEQAAFSHFPEDKKDRLQYHFLWEPNLPETPVQLAREFGIANGLTFVERFQDHYDMVAIASPVNNVQALDTYLNHLEEIKQFIQYFKNEKKQLISDGNRSRFALLPKQQDPNLQNMLVKGHVKIPVTWRHQSSYLTPKEYDCLKALALGKSVKEIAQRFKLSPRTVEGYLNRVKVRTLCVNNRELILMVRSTLF